MGKGMLCWCDSGKKYTKCHNRPIQKDDANFFYELSRQTAYIGSVGKARKVFAQKYTAFEEALYETIDSHVQAQIPEGVSISCKKGCAHCCTQYIGSSLQESDTIVHFLYNNQHIMKSFLKKYKKWRETVREHEHIFQKMTTLFMDGVNDCFSEKSEHAYLTQGAQYHALNIPCPFLDDSDGCSIYPVRPEICASVFSTSDPELCRSGATEKPLAMLIQNNVPKPTYMGLGTQIMGPLPLLVHEILQGGYTYFEDIPGLEELANTAQQSQEFRSTFHRL